MTSAERKRASSVAFQLGLFFRDVFGSPEEPFEKWGRYRHHKVIVKWGWAPGNYSTLTVEEAEVYLAWLQAGNLGGPHEMMREREWMGVADA